MAGIAKAALLLIFSTLAIFSGVSVSTIAINIPIDIDISTGPIGLTVTATNTFSDTQRALVSYGELTSHSEETAAANLVHANFEIIANDYRKLKPSKVLDINSAKTLSTDFGQMATAAMGTLSVLNRMHADFVYFGLDGQIATSVVTLKAASDTYSNGLIHIVPSLSNAQVTLTAAYTQTVSVYL